MELRKTSCCGLREYVGLQEFKDPREALMKAYNTWRSWNGAFMVFTCTTPYPIGKKLIRYIKEKGLGSVVETEVKHNPNSGNNLRVIVWCVNNKTYDSWFATENQEALEAEAAARVARAEAERVRREAEEAAFLPMIGRKIQGNARSVAQYGEGYGPQFTATIMGRRNNLIIARDSNGLEYHFMHNLLTVI